MTRSSSISQSPGNNKYAESCYSGETLFSLSIENTKIAPLIFELQKSKDVSDSLLKNVVQYIEQSETLDSEELVKTNIIWDEGSVSLNMLGI